MPALVHHRDGTCATASGNLPREEAASVKTVCDHYVTLHYGSSRGTPDCSECRAKLRERKRRKGE